MAGPRAWRTRASGGKVGVMARFVPCLPRTGAVCSGVHAPALVRGRAAVRAPADPAHQPQPDRRMDVPAAELRGFRGSTVLRQGLPRRLHDQPNLQKPHLPTRAVFFFF